MPDIDESWPGGDIGVEAGAIELARRKLEAVGDRDAVTVAADTVVVIDDDRLGKPADDAEAEAMLSRLAGRSHRVVTGFCVRGSAWREAAVSTEVRFRPLTRAEIDRYVASGEPRDKAGAYGIQGSGGALVDHVRGSYTNVVGLPLAEVIAAVEEVS